MFERTKVDNSRDVTAAAASVELDDGRRISGRFLIARSKTLLDVLNGPANFIEFEPYDGEPEVLAKSAIRSFRLVKAPAGRNPATIIRDTDDFNPYKILGLEKGADRAEVRAAFHRQAKAYHPDRYSSAELPDEVINYLAAMARRINAAHEALMDQVAKNEAFAAQRSEPVFHSSRPAV